MRSSDSSCTFFCFVLIKKRCYKCSFQSVYETYQVVLRCGLHWKNWALKRGQARGSRKPANVHQRESTADGLVKKGSKSGPDMGIQSTNTTPRFPVSLFNTPREPVEEVSHWGL